MGYIQNEVRAAVGARWAKRLSIATGVIVVWVVISSVFSIWPFSVAKGLAKKVVNENAIVYNYEWYYDQYNQIKATRANLFLLKEGSEDYIGTVMVLNQMIGDYNSKASQITRNMWMPKQDVPYQIPLFEGEK